MSAAHARLTKMFPPLARPKSPRLAALIGVLTGGIGLAIYFRSLRDLFPVEVTAWLLLIPSLVAGADPLHLEANVLGLVSMVAPVVVGGVYGFYRAQTSNRRLAASIMPGVAVGSAG